MALRPSIGNPVSFFYQLSAHDLSVTAPTTALTANKSVIFRVVDEQFNLFSDLPLSFQHTASFSLSLMQTTAVVTVFSDNLSWQALQAVIRLLHDDTAIAAQLIKPHADLPGAVQLSVTALSAEKRDALSALASELAIEAVYLSQRPLLCQPGVLVMDMDSTAIQIECIDEIAKLAGVGEQVAAVTARAMNGELDFAQSLIARVAALQGASQNILQQVLLDVPLMPGLTALVEHLQQHNWRIAIASGGFTYFTDALKQRLGLTATFANVLEIKDGVLTGRVLGDIVDANSKASVVKLLVDEHAISPAQTVAIGDGANDIPMLNAAALGVAFHAKPKVQAQAKAAIRQGSLLQLLYLLG
mgnify:FL=1